METTPIPPTRMGMEVVEPPTTHRVSWPWGGWGHPLPPPEPEHPPHVEPWPGSKPQWRKQHINAPPRHSHGYARQTRRLNRRFSSAHQEIGDGDGAGVGAERGLCGAVGWGTFPRLEQNKLEKKRLTSATPSLTTPRQSSKTSMGRPNKKKSKKQPPPLATECWRRDAMKALRIV